MPTAPALTDAEAALRVDLAAAFRLAVEHDLHEGIANHFSAVLPGGEHFLVNPFGLHFAEMSASSLLLLDLEGNVVRGEGTVAPTAHHIHAPIHRLCPQAKVLMHTHQPWATALTMIGEGRLEWALQTSVRFFGRVAYDTDYDGVALADEVGERLAKMLGSNEVLFMGNHGVMAAAPTVAQAYDDLYYLERAAKTQVLAMGTGRPLRLLDPALVEKTYAQSHYERFDFGYIEHHFAALKRLLDRRDPTYKE